MTVVTFSNIYRCEYYTYDSEIDWCYLKTAKTASTNKDIGDKKYTSGPKSEDCQSDEENEIQDDKEPAVFPEEQRALAKVTLSTVANVTESDSLDSIKEDQEVTNTTNRFKPRTPILSGSVKQKLATITFDSLQCFMRTARAQYSPPFRQHSVLALQTIQRWVENAM